MELTKSAGSGSGVDHQPIVRPDAGPSLRRFDVSQGTQTEESKYSCVSDSVQITSPSMSLNKSDISAQSPSSTQAMHIQPMQTPLVHLPKCQASAYLNPEPQNVVKKKTLKASNNCIASSSSQATSAKASKGSGGMDYGAKLEKTSKASEAKSKASQSKAKGKGKAENAVSVGGRASPASNPTLTGAGQTKTEGTQKKKKKKKKAKSSQDKGSINHISAAVDPKQKGPSIERKPEKSKKAESSSRPRNSAK
ncbi:hypothetical protein GQ607_009440 [Colletotrichum asianum]|uniref:Uncharacterized protein n=1 Tax=Colletotrichum asianum TaxID=702518 RepID=A0A8H3WCH7_9PEZI|nr:hypothetical protein GQ607_009440 [Colletotrichum asianum]